MTPEDDLLREAIDALTQECATPRAFFKMSALGASTTAHLVRRVLASHEALATRLSAAHQPAAPAWGWRAMPEVLTDEMEDAADDAFHAALKTTGEFNVMAGREKWSAFASAPFTDAMWKALLASTPLSPPAPTLDPEAVARMIEPHAFRAWQSLFDYCVNRGATEDEARNTADHFHGAGIAEALAKARTIIAMAPPAAAALFQRGDFILASGAKSTWKIECDALTAEDWAGLAAQAVERLPAFGAVEGVPRGGLPFANALRPYVTTGPLLIAEDVVTTGGSMERFRDGREAIGVAAFCRGSCPTWVTPLYIISSQSAEVERVGLEEGIAAVRCAMASSSLDDAKVWAQVALDFLTNDEAALAEGATYAPAETEGG